MYISIEHDFGEKRTSSGVYVGNHRAQLSLIMITEVSKDGVSELRPVIFFHGENWTVILLVLKFEKVEETLYFNLSTLWINQFTSDPFIGYNWISLSYLFYYKTFIFHEVFMF